MKNNILKYYIAASYFCSTFVMFGQTDPGTGTPGGSVEDTDPATTPIDDYIWVLALVGLFFVFLKFRGMQKNRIKG